MQRKLAEFESVAIDLARWLDAYGGKYVLIGGVAVAAHGVARMTHDIDAMALIPDDHWPLFLESAGKYGFESRRKDTLQFARMNRLLQLVHVATATDVDISLGFMVFDCEAVERRVWISIAETRAPIASVEDLIVMKCFAGRPQDIADVHKLLRMNGKLDIGRIRTWLRKFEQLTDRGDILREFERLNTGTKRGIL